VHWSTHRLLFPDPTNCLPPEHCSGYQSRFILILYERERGWTDLALTVDFIGTRGTTLSVAPLPVGLRTLALTSLSIPRQCLGLVVTLTSEVPFVCVLGTTFGDGPFGVALTEMREGSLVDVFT
jgi:hypothetical protein